MSEPEQINKELYECDNVKLKTADYVIDRILLYTGPVKDAFDLGCGTGIYVQTLISKGVQAIGIDKNDTIPDEMLNTDSLNLRHHDLGNPVGHLYKSRELVISFETGEHIAESRASTFAHNLTRMSSRHIVLTCCPEAGKYHLNPKPLEYWIRLVEAEGSHKYMSVASIEMMSFFKANESLEFGGFDWFKRDLMCFEARI